MGEADSENVGYSNFRNFLSCSAVQDIEFEYRCHYITKNEECQDKGYFVNYLDIMYCYFNPANDGQLYGYIMIFVFISILLFWILGISADKYFCPALEMLSKTLGLSEHLAGITLLAFGNGSPDLFTSLQSIDNETLTLFSNVLSGAIFVTAFVGGFVCVLHPFRISGNGILRDTTFLLLGVLYINYIMDTDKYVTTTEAFCFISIYFFYMAIILTDLKLIKEKVNTMERSMLQGTLSVHDYKGYVDLKGEASIEIIAQKSQNIVDIESTRSSFYGLQVGPNEKLIEQLWVSLNPIDVDEWKDGTYFQKTIICIKAPILVILAIFIPCVSYEDERHGWSKLLNCSQIVTLPFITSCAMFELKEMFGVPIIFIVFICTLPPAYVIFRITRTDAPPDFHVLFACMAAYGAIYLIFTCASEIVEVLYILGLVLNCSNSFLGCTLLSWGNGIGDLVANSALALHGYHKMAFAACIGGPFFNTIFSLGLVLVVKTLTSDDGRVELPPGPLGTNCFVFLVLVLLGTLLWSVTTNFRVRRSVAIFNLLMYTLFSVYALLSEWEVINTFTNLDDYGLEQ